MTAALASKKELVPGASSVTSEVGSSSNAQVSPAQAETQIQSSMATSANNNQIVEEEDCGRAATVNPIYWLSDFYSLLSCIIFLFNDFAGDRFLGD